MRRNTLKLLACLTLVASAAWLAQTRSSDDKSPAGWREAAPGILQTAGYPRGYALLDGEKALLVDAPLAALPGYLIEGVLLTCYHRGSCAAVGERLASVVRRSERVVLATGHPVGLAHLYIEVGRLLRDRGVKILEPADGLTWREGDRHHPWQIRYLEGVAMLTDKASARHTHSADPMERMLEAATPDLVFADHGFAGGAIERGVETVSIADVNDPALIVAKALGRTETVIVMDDNVAPQAYWPCFQAIAARLP